MSQGRLSMASDRLVFVTEFGEPCEPRNALRAFKPAAKRAGLPSSVGLHTLRHSAASVMMASGVPLKIVSDILGHGLWPSPATSMAR